MSETPLLKIAPPRIMFDKKTIISPRIFAMNSSYFNHVLFNTTSVQCQIWTAMSFIELGGVPALIGSGKASFSWLSRAHTHKQNVVVTHASYMCCSIFHLVLSSDFREGGGGGGQTLGWGRLCNNMV